MTESQLTPPPTPSTPATPATPAPIRKPPSRLRPVIFLMVVFFGVMAVVYASRLYTPREALPWRSDLPAALAQSRTTGRPVLLYFTAEWCGPCRYMRRHVWSDESVARALEGYLPVRIDHDLRQDLVVQYQVPSIPWIAVLDAEGRPVRLLDRAVETPGEFIAWLGG